MTTPAAKPPFDAFAKPQSGPRNNFQPAPQMPPGPPPGYGPPGQVVPPPQVTIPEPVVPEPVAPQPAFPEPTEPPRSSAEPKGGAPAAHALTSASRKNAASKQQTDKVTFGDAFKVGEFRALWLSQVFSGAGDRLALIALTILIYQRTQSPLLAAVAYAAGNVPYIFGALFLSGLADRFPRRTVMLAADLVRAALVIVMLIPGMPLGALIAMLYLVTLFQPPFDSARSAILGDILEGEMYAVGAATTQMTMRVLVIGGAGLGGLVVALVGAHMALGADAATFIVSGILMAAGLKSRPAPAAKEDDDRKPNGFSLIFRGIHIVFGDRALRTLMLTGWLAAFYEIPEGIAAPYAGAFKMGAVGTGLIIAASQIGAVICTPVFTKRVGPLTRLKWMGPMAVLACGILMLSAVHPTLIGSMVVFAVAGSFAIYQIPANTEFVKRIPNGTRAQAFGLANAGLIVGQGVAFAVAGAACEIASPPTVIAVGGGIGAVLGVYLWLRWRGLTPAVGRHSARHLSRTIPEPDLEPQPILAPRPEPRLARSR